MTHRGPFQPLPFCDSVICKGDKKTKVEQSSSSDHFVSMISVLVFLFQGVALSLLYMVENRKGLVAGNTKRTQGCEGPLGQEVQCWWKKEVRVIQEAVSQTGSGGLRTKSTVQWHCQWAHWNYFCDYVCQHQTLVESLQENVCPSP